MFFYPSGDLFDPLWVPGGWDLWAARPHHLPAEHQPHAEMLAVAEFIDRGWQVIAGCPCGWEGPLRASRQQTVVERLATEECERCGGRGLELVEIRAPTEIEGLALELGDDAWDGIDDDPGLAFDAMADDFDLPADYGWPEDWPVDYVSAGGTKQ